MIYFVAGLYNPAWGANVEMSGQSQHNIARLGVDGNLDPVWKNNTNCFKTGTSTMNYWLVYLPEAVNITSVIVTTRSDSITAGGK